MAHCSFLGPTFIFCHLSTHPKTHTQTWHIATIIPLSLGGGSKGSSTAMAATNGAGSGSFAPAAAAWRQQRR
jgi:hypothetical protein